MLRARAKGESNSIGQPVFGPKVPNQTELEHPELSLGRVCQPEPAL